MPPKRPTDGAPTGADLKRQRMRAQRTIAVEGQKGRAGGSAGSGNAGLPAVLEVEKFAQARVFEITAMQRAMKSAKEAGTQRAFQSLPRHLRRRAASHNIRRLPSRLRERAKAEVPKDAAKPKRVSRSMLGRHRQKPGIKAELFRQRQQNKLWLETHVWHAKRMHMTEIWGHRLAETPTAKAFRSSYRASHHGALVHDASYYQYFQLDGPFADLERILQAVCDPAAVSPASKRFSSGSRECTVDVYDTTRAYPNGLLGPATFIWRPEIADSAPSTSTASPSRTLLVRVHPAVARHAASSVQHAIEHLKLGLSVGLRRYEKGFLTFEVTGRRATEVVKAVLKPVKGTDGATKAAWRKLDAKAGPGGVPEGMVFGLEVYDPRLSFPPQLEKASPDTVNLERLVPAPPIASAPTFWDIKHRASIHTPRFKKRDLDARRAEELIPGTRLAPLAQDDRIPVLLSQRIIGSQSTSPSRSRPPPIHGWTLTVPAGWGMPFWSSLVYSTPRVAGIRERSHQYYEAGAPRFPEDYVGSPGFDEHETRREADEQGYWERRPPAKRPNYDKFGTRSPWKVEMGEVLTTAWSRSGFSVEQEEGNSAEGRPFLVPASIARFVLRHVDASDALSGMMQQDPPAGQPTPRQRLQQLEVDLLAEWAAASTSADPSCSYLSRAMVRVRLTPCTRGVPEDLGLVYELDEEQASLVREKVDKALKGKKVLATGEGEGAEDLCDPPSPDQVIGRITTGQFCLSQGHGDSIAVVSLYRLLAMAKRSPGLQRLVLCRNRDSETFRAATVELL
ncbi:ribonuclease P/MRP protein subunit POP1 [Rhodotorula toruloides NP11]|uniref:Ribonuclease P/MRP protein subunit POP1 n=1 Tax=Rhodotorula toruloides (strain NP11) TaxID=1130832 RepID=M7X5I1_RHOT1|nr:ribonuclease P/MRP protein subunit POP1 [Rhodotorula toruloides NP11]EMS18934.1 ribonuclease P/MRP protein subunit POP1 [Rhodotorula toruloides NP11]